MKEGTLVKCNISGFDGTGTIHGRSDIDGSIYYIIRPFASIMSSDYPYTQFICHESCIQQLETGMFNQPEDRRDSIHHHTNRLD